MLEIMPWIAIGAMGWIVCGILVYRRDQRWFGDNRMNWLALLGPFSLMAGYITRWMLYKVWSLFDDEL